MIPNIDGNRLIPLPSHGVVKPETQKRIRGEGLPLPKQPHRRGDIIVNFDITFPEYLSAEQQQFVRNGLP